MNIAREHGLDLLDLLEVRGHAKLFKGPAFGLSGGKGIIQ